jgi:hypothetical protein
MEVVELQIFQFHELDEQAKNKAREWYRYDMDYHWGDESLQSIQAFCDHFGIRLITWSVAPYSSPDYHADYFNSHFRGMKLKDFERDHMPTGYCLDCDLWMTFYDEFKRTGSAKTAFDKALWAGFIAWRNDMEAQLKDDYIDDHIQINEWSFTEDGKFYPFWRKS